MSILATDRFAHIYPKVEKVINHIKGLLAKGYTLSCAFSSGKDSSVLLVLSLEALRQFVSEGGRPRKFFITHSDTLCEAPAIHYLAMEMINRIEEFAERNKLDKIVEVIVATPSISSTFAFSHLGRGKLWRYPGLSRECSQDWKIKPQERAIKAILKTVQDSSDCVTLVGTRFDESSDRKSRMLNRGDGPTSLVGNDEGFRSNACIADWEIGDIYDFLMSIDSKRIGAKPFIETFVEDFEWMLSIYRDSNEGMCNVLIGDAASKSACGSRHGCSICLASGKTDRSMTSMINTNPEMYLYLEELNKFRDYLFNIRWDLSRREWIGRGLSKAGYTGIRPDNFNSQEKYRQLGYLLTIQELEKERAEEHEAKLAIGEIEPTTENKRLAYPQFEYITPQLLLAIDFAWGLHRDTQWAFPALCLWYEIVHLGRRMRVPDVEMYPEVPLPEKRWFKVENNFEHKWGADGLRDFVGESLNDKRRDDGFMYMSCKDKVTGIRRRVVVHEESDSGMDIDPVEANIFVNLEFPEMYMDAAKFDPSDGVKYILDRGLVKPAKGTISKYDFMVRRSMYWDRLWRELNVDSLDAYVASEENTISNEEHDQLLAEVEREEKEAETLRQPDIFGGLDASESLHNAAA